jgi:N-acetylglucosamine-6-sulfatase
MIRRASALLALLTCLLCGPGPVFAQPSAACQAIIKACTDAGMVNGRSDAKIRGNANGKRFVRNDCLVSVLHGQVDLATLPGLDPTTVAECRASRKRSAAGAAGANDVASTSAAVAPVTALKPPAGRPATPNIVMVLVDDFSMNLMTQDQGILQKSMPNLARMMKDGVSFSHYYVTDSLCCPSRASIFTGLMPHNSGVFTNQPPNGGYGAYMTHGDDGKAFAVALHAAFYQTAMMGKYLNGYEPDSDPVAQGWSEWAVAGNAYANFDYVLNHNGALIRSPLHLTDELSQLAQDYLTNSAAGPFFLEVATFSPHAPFVPPLRYARAYSDLTYPKTPAYLAKPDAAAPEWLARMKTPDAAEQARMLQSFLNRVRSDKGIDDMIGALRQKLADLGLADNTYVIFTSDNGFHMGEYSLETGKLTPFDTDINVPLVVVGPGIPAGTTMDATAMNIDLAPTFTAWTGAAGNPDMDGHSLDALLKGQPAGPWRQIAVVEHKHDDGNSPNDPDRPGKKSGNPPDYTALRLPGAMYVEYTDGSGVIGYYDLKSDPYELRNVAAQLSPARKAALHAALLANQTCKGPQQCWTAQSMTP